MFKKLSFVIALLLVFGFASQAKAAYQSTFDAINFTPAIDGGGYFSVYGSRTLTPWQANIGTYFDYANRPLEFRATAGAVGRQSVIDHAMIMNTYGAFGVVDWFEIGVNVPIVMYNWFYTANAAATADFGASMADMMIMTKFKAVDIDKYPVGLSFVPYVSLPTGDVNRFSGNGHVMGGLNMIFDVKFHSRFEMSLNAGYLMRDDVQQTFNFANGSTSTIRVDDKLTFGMGANFKASRYIQLVTEVFGDTQMLHGELFTTNTTSLEAGGGAKFFIGDTGVSLIVGGSAGLIEGVGTPRFRGFFGANWTTPETRDCPPCAPDPRIKDNKIVIWGKIFFDTAKATIKKVSYPVLDDVVDVLRTHPEIRLVEIQGHCDWRGSDSYNLNLSQRRSESVRQYLIAAGISGVRLRAVGYGESQPIASNDTVEGMSQNRRVEFVIIESNGGYSTGANQAEVKSSMYEPVHEIKNGVTVEKAKSQMPKKSALENFEPQPLVPVSNKTASVTVPQALEPEPVVPTHEIVAAPLQKGADLQRVGGLTNIPETDESDFIDDELKESDIPVQESDAGPDMVPNTAPVPVLE